MPKESVICVLHWLRNDSPDDMHFLVQQKTLPCTSIEKFLTGSVLAMDLGLAEGQSC